MKKMNLVISIIILLLFSINSFAQETKKDIRIQQYKEDGLNYYKSDHITELDLVQALEIAGIRIHKFYIGEYDKVYNLNIVVDEYKNGKIVETDTIYSGDNKYMYPGLGTNDLYSSYIDQIKIFSKEEEDKITIIVNTYKTEIKKEITIHKADKKQYFMFRNFIYPRWKLNKKIPMMVYASSRMDEKAGGYRFCGVVNLSEDDEGTKELLSYSPNYFLINYMVTEAK